MTAPRNMTTKFRAALRAELPQWTQQGLISEATLAELRTAYQLDNLKDESSRLLSSVIFTVGGLLLGGGFISFVAANWEQISDPLKLVLLFSTLIGLHALGYWLWHHRGWSRLGHALMFTGCLVFGANIGLVAQIYHISGNWYGAFGAWTLGSLVVAWAVRSWPIGLLALLTSFVWFGGFQDETHSRLALLYPLGVAAFISSLAWIIRCRILYAASAVAIVAAGSVLSGTAGSGIMFLLAITVSGLVLWTTGEIHRRSQVRPEFASITSALGLTVLAFAAYIWTFKGVWNGTSTVSVFSAWVIIFAVLSIAGTAWLATRTRTEERRLLLGIFAVGATLAASGVMHIMGSARPLPMIIIANLAAFVLGGTVIGISLLNEQRTLFWLGTLFLVLLILTRFLEYETSLLLKSAAFVACGVAVILAGIRYEQYLRRREVPREGSLEPGSAV